MWHEVISLRECSVFSRSPELFPSVHSLTLSPRASAELGGYPLQVHLSPVPEHQWAHLQQECVAEGLVSCTLKPEGLLRETLRSFQPVLGEKFAACAFVEEVVPVGDAQPG